MRIEFTTNIIVNTCIAKTFKWIAFNFCNGSCRQNDCIGCIRGFMLVKTSLLIKVKQGLLFIIVTSLGLSNIVRIKRSTSEYKCINYPVVIKMKNWFLPQNY